METRPQSAPETVPSPAPWNVCRVYARVIGPLALLGFALLWLGSTQKIAWCYAVGQVLFGSVLAVILLFLAAAAIVLVRDRCRR